MGNTTRRRVDHKPNWRTDVRPHDIYRMYDRFGRLLYVGVSNRSNLDRIVEHSRTKSWWNDVASITLKHLECTRTRAEQIERDAIIAERPLHNVTHNQHPWTVPTYGEIFHPWYGPGTIVVTWAEDGVQWCEAYFPLVGHQTFRAGEHDLRPL